MRDQVGYFGDAFDEVGPYLPDAPPGRVFAQQLIDLFGGLDTETKSLTLLESLPLAAIDIGGTSWDGWSLLDGNVLVLRTSGHTAGHVAVYLPGPKVLHLADETTGYYQTFRDADPAANLLTFQRAANAVRNGAVDALTDGHSFSLHRGDEAVAYLTSMINGAIAYDTAVTRVLNEHADEITVADLVSDGGRCARNGQRAERCQQHTDLQIHADRQQAEGTRHHTANRSVRACRLPPLSVPPNDRTGAAALHGGLKARRRPDAWPSPPARRGW